MNQDNETLAARRAMVMLETDGSTSYPPVALEQDGETLYRWAETNYAPEWLSSSDLDGADPDECITVLSYDTSGRHRAPEGYREVYSYAAGEKDCPDCGAGTGNEESRPTCQLCEGTGYLYEGEECQVVVFAPRYSYGSGTLGCLYDSGPHSATSVEEAIEALERQFQDLPEQALRRMRAGLRKDRIYYFPSDLYTVTDYGTREAHRALAGADYCEINDLGKDE